MKTRPWMVAARADCPTAKLTTEGGLEEGRAGELWLQVSWVTNVTLSLLKVSQTLLQPDQEKEMWTTPPCLRLL